MPPVYDTIAAAQMTLKNKYEFRKLFDCGLKKLAADLCKEPLPTFSAVTDGKHFDELDAQGEETVRYGAADSDFVLRLYNLFNNWFDMISTFQDIIGLQKILNLLRRSTWEL